MAFTKETIRNKEQKEFIKNLKPNLRKDDDLEKYLSFGAGAIDEIAAENIPYINEYLQGVNYAKEQDGEDLIAYIDESYIHQKLNKKTEITSEEEPKKDKKQKAKSQEVKIKANEITEIEPLYAQHVYKDSNYASIAREEECFMHNWVGNHWKRLSKLEGQQSALKWLEEKHPDKATAKNAYGCFETAKLGLLNKRSFPEQSKDLIFIPLIDYWLMINKEGTAYIMKPNKSIGLTHQINVKIGDLKKEIVDDLGNIVQVKESLEDGVDEFGKSFPRMIEYHPKSLPENSLWKKFLDSSQPNIENQNVLQEYTGYTLLNDTRYQKGMVHVGDGSNGKGVYAEVIANLHKNVISILMEKLSNFGLSQLPDASLAVVAESPKKGINEEMLKQLISGDRVVIEIKRLSQFTLKPFAKWVICCNSFPRIQDETDGVWRRLIIMPWEKQFKEANKILNLEKRIVEEEMGIVLDWALTGLQRLLKRGENGDFIIPEHLQVLKSKEKQKSNNVIPFIENTYLVKCSEAFTKKDDIFKRYQAYCLDKGILPYGNSEFWKRVGLYFKEGLFEKKKTDCGERKYYINLVFKPNMECDEEEGDNPFEV
ncbi:phage/plasmid primase, P4 family [Cupriavidus sp. H19C3]|uniref:DNA primase family protein n=1 Tax=Cupriavidus sp. H19C3 TaxID=3241603 RepID=UPI003BF8DD9F